MQSANNMVHSELKYHRTVVQGANNEFNESFSSPPAPDPFFYRGSNGVEVMAPPQCELRRRLHDESGLKCRLLPKVKGTPLGSDHSGSRTLFSLIMLYNIRYNEMID